METKESPPLAALPPPPGPKPRRHGCLTFVLIAGAALFVYFLLSPNRLDEYRNSGMAVPDWAETAHNVLLGLKLVAFLALWYFRKWGLYLFVAATAAQAALYFWLGESLPATLNVLMAIPLLVFFLKLGEEDQAWRYLK